MRLFADTLVTQFPESHDLMNFQTLIRKTQNSRASFLKKWNRWPVHDGRACYLKFKAPFVDANLLLKRPAQRKIKNQKKETLENAFKLKSVSRVLWLKAHMVLDGVRTGLTSQTWYNGGQRSMDNHRKQRNLLHGEELFCLGRMLASWRSKREKS